MVGYGLYENVYTHTTAEIVCQFGAKRNSAMLLLAICSQLHVYLAFGLDRL